MINCTDEKLEEKVYKLKKRFIEIFAEIGYGHLTTSFSEAEILAVLYYRIMRYDVSDPEWSKRDRFVLSKGHGAGMLISVFEDLGMLSKADVKNFIKSGEWKKIKALFYPGFEFYGGSLGLGLGMASGLAMGARLNREDWFTFCLLGDAECYEGSIYEAMLFAGHNKLNNLIAIVDRNYLGCSDFTENMCKLEPFEAKWESCGWNTMFVNGHSIAELTQALKDIRSRKTDKPTCIIAETVKGNGIDYLSNIPLMHGYMPKEQDAEKALKTLESDITAEK